MEKMIREYEKEIAKRTEKKLGPIERMRLVEYHREMVANFQHERMVHLIIMLFFVMVSLGLLAIFMFTSFNYGFLLEMIPFYILIVIVVVLTGFYIKHYYFLENHIQELYEYTKKLMKV